MLSAARQPEEQNVVFPAVSDQPPAVVRGRALIYVIPGLVLLGISAFLTSPGLEHLMGRATGSLQWGPVLFRALLSFHALLLLFIGVRTYRRATPRVSGPPLFPRLSAGVWVALTAMSVMAVALRAWHLNTCLWLDEVLTMVDFARPPLGQILTSFPNQNQHMLFSVLAHASIRLFGESGWALRLPSVLFGVASIWALFLLARKIIGEKQALAACLLMTVSYHHIWFSQNARGYMGLLFFSILATWLWLEALDRGEWRIWIAYSLTLFLGLSIHMTIVFVIAAHVLVQGLVFLHNRDTSLITKGLLSWLLAGTLALQMIALPFPEFLRTALHEVSMPSEWTNPLWLIMETVRSLQLGFASFIAVAAALAMVLFGWLDLLRKDARAAAAMVLPALIGGGVMLWLSHNLWPRFFFFCMGFALIVVIHGAMSFPSFVVGLIGTKVPVQRLAARAGTLMAMLLVVVSAITVPRCYALPKQDYTGAMEYVRNSGTTDDSVVVVGLAGHVYGRYYAPRWFVAHTVQELQEFRGMHSNSALIYTLPIELKAFHPDLWRAVGATFDVVRVFPGTLGGGEVFVCRPKELKVAERAVLFQ